MITPNHLICAVILQILTMKNNRQIQKEKFIIAVRVRPYLSEDKKVYKTSETEPILTINNQSSITIQRKNSQQKTFRFNHIFRDENQDYIYEKSQHLVDSVFQGFNATFLAYGQTGTGKTHTIFGSKDIHNIGDDKGYFHRAADHIFAKIKQQMQMRQFAVRISFFEFYLDNIYDLIENDGKKLDIKETTDDGIHIRDAAQIPVKSVEQLFSSVKSAIVNRKTEETSINKRSSRSHAVIQIQVLQRWNQNGETKYQKGMLKIVDLAGSERVSKTQSFGSRLQQAKRINKQITTLGKCINMLAQNQKQSLNNRSDVLSKFNFSKTHIPFRDSKITRFLTDTLDGRAKITLCVCVSPFTIHLEQTFSSLMFAAQASTLKIQSRRNQIYTMKRSVDKTPTKVFETPIKMKGQVRANKQQNQGDKKKDEKALDSLMQEINEIQDYLQGKGIQPEKASKEQLQNNLITYEKIFRTMRNKFERDQSRKTSSIHYA